MDTAWRFRLVLIMTFAIIIFGDMLGYANVKGDKSSNQRTVDPRLKKSNSNHRIQRNIDGKDPKNKKKSKLINKSVHFYVLIYLNH